MSSPQQYSDLVQRRIESERRYHDEHYRHAGECLRVNFDLSTERRRRPHNLTWAYYDTIRGCFGGRLAGRRLLVVGCGLGSVALNLASEGARVEAFDVSGEAIAACQRRAAHYKVEGVRFFVSAFEELDVPENTYDAVVGEMVLHHLDIPTAVEQSFRFLKPGGYGVFSEWKIYPGLDAVRSHPLMRRLFPPGGVEGYATEHERKLSPDDFANIRRRFPDLSCDVRYCLCGKVRYFSQKLADRLERLDYLLLRSARWLQPFSDGVVLRFTKSVGNN